MGPWPKRYHYHRLEQWTVAALVSCGSAPVLIESMLLSWGGSCSSGQLLKSCAPPHPGRAQTHLADHQPSHPQRKTFFNRTFFDVMITPVYSLNFYTVNICMQLLMRKKNWHFSGFQFLSKLRKFRGGIQVPRALSRRRSLSFQVFLRFPRNRLSRRHICSSEDFDEGEVGDADDGRVKGKRDLLTQWKPLLANLSFSSGDSEQTTSPFQISLQNRKKRKQGGANLRAVSHSSM